MADKRYAGREFENFFRELVRRDLGAPETVVRAADPALQVDVPAVATPVMTG